MSPNPRREWAPALLTGLLVVVASTSDAASFVLSADEQAAALQVGRRSVLERGFGSEWVVDDGRGQTLTVMTPFHRVALAARQAAFKDEEPGARDLAAVVREASGRLVVRATLRGETADFARRLVPVLLVDGREVKASFVQNERTAAIEPDGRHAARCVYAFPVQGVPPDARVTLLVRAPRGSEAARFLVDLSAMR